MYSSASIQARVLGQQIIAPRTGRTHIAEARQQEPNCGFKERVRIYYLYLWWDHLHPRARCILLCSTLEPGHVSGLSCPAAKTPRGCAAHRYQLTRHSNGLGAKRLTCTSCGSSHRRVLLCVTHSVRDGTGYVMACARMLAYHMRDQANMSNADFRCSENYKC
jgi:hypothetical protein